MTTALHEPFLLADRISEVVGLARSTATATKDAGNPLIAPAGATATWDQLKSMTSAVTVGGRVHIFYYGAEVGFANPHACYAYTDDGSTIVKPNVGTVTYGGSTNNNITLSQSFADARYDPIAGEWLIVINGNEVDFDHRYHIFTAPAPTGPWTLQVSLGSSSSYWEAKSLLRRPDGRYVAYTVAGHDSDSRSLSAFLSDTTSLTGSWTEVKNILKASSSAHQIYHLGTHQVGDFTYGLVVIFDQTALGGLGSLWIDLYGSRDGLNFTLVKENFIPLGTAGAWDDGQIIAGASFAELGNEWHVYYCGSPEAHDTTPGGERGIGRATVAKARTVAYAGTGHLLTELLPIHSATAALTVNASGPLAVGVLDRNGVTLPGYSAADCDPITGDSTAHAVTWGGLGLPEVDEVSLRFEATGATLYSFDVTGVGSASLPYTSGSAVVSATVGTPQTGAMSMAVRLGGVTRDVVSAYLRTGGVTYQITLGGGTPPPPPPDSFTIGSSIEAVVVSVPDSFTVGSAIRPAVVA